MFSLLLVSLSSVFWSRVSFGQNISFNYEGDIYCYQRINNSIGANEIDLYGFYAYANYSMVEFTTCGSDFDSYLYLLTANLSIIDYDDDSCFSNDAVLTLYDVEYGDHYYIGVGGFDTDDFGNYTLNVTCTEYSSYTTSSLSNTSDYSYAGEIGCGEMAYGSIGSYDQNYYGFNLTEYYEGVRISTCGSDFDTYLYLYDMYGGLIDSCDDCGGCGTRTVLTEYGLDTGRYYIFVGGYSSDSGDYVLNISCGDFEPTTTEIYDPFADFDCNHIYDYPLPMPCLYSGYRGITAECDDDDGGVWINSFNMSDCSGDAYRRDYWNSSSYQFTRGFVSCDYDDSCGYFELSVYNETTDDDCDDGNLVLNAPIVVDECVSYGGESYAYSCDDDSATQMRYNCADCDDDCLVNETNLVDMYTDQGYCVQLECDSTGAGSGSDSDDGDRNLIGVRSISINIGVLLCAYFIGVYV